MANVKDAAQKSFDFFFFSDEVRGRECERLEVSLSCSIDSEQSVSLDNEELQKFLEEQKNYNT